MTIGKQNIEIIVGNDGQEIPCIRVRASELSERDKFFAAFVPETENEKKLWEYLKEIMKKKKVKDFLRPIMDPSFPKHECYFGEYDRSKLIFCKGEKPAVGCSYEDWIILAKKLCPKRKSRLCNMDQYVAFLGVLMKAMVNQGTSVEETWRIVCENSSEIAYVEYLGWAAKVLPTGTKGFGVLCDLGNVYKLIQPTRLAKQFENIKSKFKYYSVGCSVREYQEQIGTWKGNFSSDAKWLDAVGLIVFDC